MSQKISSPLIEDVFYDFYTKKVVPGDWHQIDVETYNASLGRQTWELRAAVAGTPSGAKLTGL